MKSKNIDYNQKIDHIRCLAAVFVIAYHSLAICAGCEAAKINQQLISSSFLARILSQGHSAVGLFMTLSGFIFAIICKDKEINLWKFYRNRLLRIYPLFIFLLLVACSLNPCQNDFWSLFRSIFFTQNEAKAVFCPHFTEVFWTIPVEFQFYLIFPFLLLFYRKYSLRYLVFVIVLAFSLRVAVFYLDGSVFGMATTTIFGRIDQFVVGMIIGLSYEKVKYYFQNPIILAAIASLCLWMLWYFALPLDLDTTRSSPLWIWHTLVEGIACGLFILSYNASRFKLPAMPSKWLAWLGAISFSLYTNHFFFLRIGTSFYLPLVFGHHKRYPLLCQLANYLQIHPLTNIFCFLFTIELPITIFSAILTYFVIESPFLSLRSEYILNKKPELQPQ